jgi:hypothetical protein
MNRWYLLVAFLPALGLFAQTPLANPAPSSPTQASVRFSFDWAQGFPWQSYSITVQSDGKSHFDGIPHADETNDTDAYQQDFTMSDANRQKVFELAQKLHYFQGDYDSHLKHVAQTGKKSLQYQSPQANGSTTYNYSQNADIQQLTNLFTGIAMTIDFGRKLAYQYRYDKLGMDDRLKQLEDLQASHGVEELEILAPMLRKIWKDPNLMNISRESARRLLLIIDQPASAGQNPATQ